MKSPIYLTYINQIHDIILFVKLPPPLNQLIIIIYEHHKTNNANINYKNSYERHNLARVQIFFVCLKSMTNNPLCLFVCLKKNITNTPVCLFDEKSDNSPFVCFQADAQSAATPQESQRAGHRVRRALSSVTY